MAKGRKGGHRGIEGESEHRVKVTSGGDLDKSDSSQCGRQLACLKSALGLAWTKFGEDLLMGKEESRMGPRHLTWWRDVTFTEPWETG